MTKVVMANNSLTPKSRFKFIIVHHTVTRTNFPSTFYWVTVTDKSPMVLSISDVKRVLPMCSMTFEIVGDLKQGGEFL